LPFEAVLAGVPLRADTERRPGTDERATSLAGRNETFVFQEAEGLALVRRQRGRADNAEGLSLAIADASSDEALGAVVLMFRPQPGNVEIGYWMIERARGRRFASRAVALLARWALTDAGLARVQALVEPDNTASQRVLESVGFRREGHLRSYLVFDGRRGDAFIYSLLPSDLG